MHLTPERAREIARELGGWFGPPVLCRVPISEVRSADEVLDGSVRLAALPWDRSAVPCVVFPLSHRGGLFSVDGQQLPRMLAVFGHAERAWPLVPDHWRDSPQALEAFLGCGRETAASVWAVGAVERARGYQRRQIHGRKDRCNAEKVSMLRGIVRAWAVGEAYTMADVAEILGVKV